MDEKKKPPSLIKASFRVLAPFGVAGIAMLYAFGFVLDCEGWWVGPTLVLLFAALAGDVVAMLLMMHILKDLSDEWTKHHKQGLQPMNAPEPK